MRTLLIALALLSSSANAVSFNGTASFSSDYMFRGISFSSHKPVVQGLLNVNHEGLDITMLTGPVNTFNLDELVLEPDFEFDTFVSYSHAFGDVTVGGGFNTFLYVKNQTNDMLELSGRVLYGDFRLNLGYIHNFVGLGYFNYNQLIWTPHLSDEFMLTSHLAYANFQNPDLLATTNCFDYKVGLAYMSGPWYVEAFYTNTIGRWDTIANVEMQDANIAFTVAHTFTLANN